MDAVAEHLSEIYLFTHWKVTGVYYRKKLKKILNPSLMTVNLYENQNKNRKILVY